MYYIPLQRGGGGRAKIICVGKINGKWEKERRKEKKEKREKRGKRKRKGEKIRKKTGERGQQFREIGEDRE